MKLTIFLLSVLAAVGANAGDHKKWMEISLTPKVAPKQLNPKFKENFESGTDDEDPKIVGGSNAGPHEFPWQVGLYITNPDGYFFCGGSLINQDWVLTAAHCTVGASMITVVLGAININDPGEASQVRVDSTTIITHENYNGNVGLEFDIGLIRLPFSIGYNGEIAPINLPSYSHYMNGGNWLTASGWGQTDFGGANDLQKVTVPAMSDEQCSTIANTYGGTVLCTDSAGGHGICFGDSGGPLMYLETNGLMYHEGVNSFVIGDCTAGYPNGYTRTTSYLGWISAQTGIPIDP